MAQPPAAIRYNNPGAMYPGPSATRYGSTGYGVIGGGHKIAQFADPVDGAAAQFDLLNRGYANMTLRDLIHKWSGGNSSAAYANAIASRTGIGLDDKVTPEMLRDANFAVPFAKAKAQWETGQAYPLTDEQWRQAHARATGGEAPQTPASGTAVAGLGGNASAMPFGMSIPAPAESAPQQVASASPASAGQDVGPFSLGGVLNALGGGSGGSAPDAEPQTGVAGAFNSLGGGGGMLKSMMADEPKQAKEADPLLAAQQQLAQQQQEMMPQQPINLSRLMSVLQNRSRLGTA
jgi:hypothetical protein